MSTKIRIGVIFGGKSAEHEVSVITGIQVLNNLDSEKYEIIPIYVSKKGMWYTNQTFFKPDAFKNLNELENNNPEFGLLPLPLKNELHSIAERSFFKKEVNKVVDVFYPCFHGGVGENGSFQGLCEMAEIPYVGSGVLGSAAGMDKIAMKHIFVGSNLPVATFSWFYRTDWQSNPQQVIKKLEKELNYPVFVKPANAGSSIGIAKAGTQEELSNAIEVALFYDRKVIVEEAFTYTKEINISVMGNSGGTLQVSACEQVAGSADFLTYDDKYKSEGGKSSGMASTKRIVPAPIEEENRKLIEDLAKKAFEALDCAGLVRIDFLLDENTNKAIIIEVNTIPGSMAFYLWQASDVSFSDLNNNLVELAIQRGEESKKNLTTFSTNLLETFSPSLKSPKLNQ